MKCCVPDCAEELKPNTSEKNGITFHKFPKDPNLRNLLLEALRLQIKPNSRTVLCSRHFDGNNVSYSVSKEKLSTVQHQRPVTDLQMCRMCLCTDRKVYYIGENDIAQQYELLTANKDCVGDVLPQYICWECKARLASFARLRSVALRSLELLHTLNDSMVGDETTNVKFVIDRESNNLATTLNCWGLEVTHYPSEGWIDVLDINTNDNTSNIQNINDNYQNSNLKNDINSIETKTINDIQSSNLRKDYNNISALILENENDNIENSLLENRNSTESKRKNVNQMNTENVNDNIIMGNSHLGKIIQVRSLKNLNDNINNLGNENVNDNSDVIKISDDSFDNFDEFDDHSDLEPKTANINNCKIDDESSNDSDLSETSESELENSYHSELDDIMKDFDSTNSEEEIDSNIDSDLAKLEQVFNEKKLETITALINSKLSEDNDNFLEEVEPKKVLAKFFVMTDLSKDEQMKQLDKRKETDNYKNAGLKCEKCFRGFIYEKTFKTHQLKHTKAYGTHRCPICRLNYKTYRKFKGHFFKAHAFMYTCKERYCDFVCYTHEAAASHSKYHKGTVHTCPKCDRTFTKMSTFLTHVRVKHPSDKVCRLCGHSFVSDMGLKMHTRKMHRLDNLEVPEDGPQCVKCNIQFSNDSALITHYRESNKHKDFRPEEKKRDPNSVKRIYSASKPRPPFVSTRGKDGVTKGEQCLTHLYEHNLTHKGDKQFSCTQCGKSFSNSMRLKLHEKIHLKRKYPCEVCSKKFSTRGNVTKHMVIHQGIKFECEICGKCFNHSEHKKAHIDYVHLKKPGPKRNRAVRNKRKIQEPVQMEISTLSLDETTNIDENSTPFVEDTTTSV